VKPAATYDIETEKWTTFVLGAIHYADGRTVLYNWDREDEMAQALLAIDGEVWAHNGGRFDHLWLLDHTIEEADLVSNTSGIITLRFQGSRAVFCDSIRVFPFSLRVLTNGAKQSLETLCTCETSNCGGYCAIRRDMAPHIRKIVTDYLIADVEELMEALRYFGECSEEWNLSIKKTLGGTSWASASEQLGIESMNWDRSLWERVRESYYGGRCEVLRTESPTGFVCDVNSMYPWALTQPIPVGEPIPREGKGASDAFSSAAPGVYRCTVSGPGMWLPVLPARCTTGLAFPTGKHTGTWPLPELVYAMSLGYRVERVHTSVNFREEVTLFEPWVNFIFNTRMKYGKKTREGKWLKWIANSLTGKLGSKCISKRLKVRPDFSQLSPCQCDLGTECICGGWRPIDERGRVWEQTVASRKIESCAHPEWAGYLTGYGRIKLHKQLSAHDGDAVYCDTDSCWSVNKRESLGDGLGEWADEGEYKDFQALGPKSYHAFVKGDEVTKMKGIPKPNWEECLAGVPQKFESMRSVKRANGGNFFERIKTSRKVTPNTGRRKLLGKKDVRTYPPDASELELA
jgi:hypothetical protein